VNPHDIEGMARTMATALSMPLLERRMRWEAMMTKLRGNTIRQWFAGFVYALQDEVAGKIATKDPIGADPATLWSPRSANSGARYH
jgi:trehalose 6-phosphate synthase